VARPGPHHPDQAEARTPGDRPGEVRGLLRGVQRRPEGADVHGRPAGQRAPGNVQVQADPDLGVAVAQHAVHHVQVGLRVGHDRDVLPGPAVRRQRPQRPAVHGRVGDQQVVAGSRVVQPEGFGQRIAHDAPVAGGGQGALDQEAAAQRLGRHPDRMAPVPVERRPAGQVGGVPVEHAEIDEGQRRVQVGGGAVVPRADGLRGAVRNESGMTAALVDRHARTVDQRW